jgi:hypothetical protein
MSITLFSCDGGEVLLPDRVLVLVSRTDGGNLIVKPPRDVWERGELTFQELTMWAALVAATGRAMLEVLPQLRGGCINYWEAGNWALHVDAEPQGPKSPAEHRKVHLHVLGRSRTATDPSWRWGEAPKFPNFAERHSWAARFKRLTGTECRAIVERLGLVLRERYEFEDGRMRPWALCPACGYPMSSGGS